MKGFNFKLILCTLLSIQNLFAQKVLGFQEYLTLVYKNHPLIKQADIYDLLGAQEVRLARGGFDPKFDFDMTQKVYSGKKYYDYLDFGLKIPTWYGADIKMGYENNSGVNQNPADYTPKGGLMFAGLEVDLKGIVFDERRLAVRTAQNMQKLNKAERLKYVTKTVFSATKDYWEWFMAYTKYQMKLQNYELALQTYEAVVGKIVGGDMAKIDSVEAAVNLYEREIELKDSKNELKASSLNLSLNLWTETLQPLELEEATQPEDLKEQPNLPDTTFQSLYDKMKMYQPEIQKLNLKILKLELDKKLYSQLFLPQATAYGKYLNSPTTFDMSDVNTNYLSKNYKFGIHLIQPIFLRKDRAKLQASKLKIKQTTFEQIYTVQQYEVSLKQTLNDIEAYNNIFKTQLKMYKAAEKLYEGEKAKFEAGEATLFYLNVRQTKMYESKIKTVSYYAKLQKAIAQLSYICAELPQSTN